MPVLRFYLKLKIKFVLIVKYLSFIIVFLVACQQPTKRVSFETMQGAWLAGGLQLDHNVFRPASQFMLIDSSSKITTISGGWRDTLQDLTIRKDSILFPYRTLPISAVRFDSELLTIGKSYPLSYKKVSPPSIDIDSSTIREDILLGQWVSEERILGFEGEDLTIYDKYSLEKRKTCWDVYDFHGIKFLQIKGSFAGCDMPYDALGLIHEISEDSMIVEQWIDGDFKKMTYKKREVSTSDYKFPEFRLCDPYLYENYSADWYYYKYTGFNGGLYRLRQIFEDRYKVVNEGVNNGLLKVSFVINCVGEIGKITTQEMSGDYDLIRMNPKISNQVRSILQNAGNWVPGERRDRKLDSFKYLIFKIKDGKIDEIYP